MNRQYRSGYTLMEMLLVVAVLVAVAALAWPSLRGPLANQKLRKSGDLVRAELARARNRAMRTGRIQAFRYQPGTGHYTVEPWFADDDFLESNVRTVGQAPVDEGIVAQAVQVELPEGVIFSGSAVEMTTRDLDSVQDGSQIQALGQVASPNLLFYPDGTSSTARIIIANQGTSYSLIIQLRGLTGISKITDLLNPDQLEAALNPVTTQ